MAAKFALLIMKSNARAEALQTGSTVRYPGIKADDAFGIAEQAEVQPMVAKPFLERRCRLKGQRSACRYINGFRL